MNDEQNIEVAGQKMGVQTAVEIAFEAGSLSICDMFIDTAEQFGADFAYEVLKDFRGDIIDKMNELHAGAGDDIGSMSQKLVGETL
jgi:hypothetical protein